MLQSMNVPSALNAAADQLPQSALSYAAVDLSAADFQAPAGKPFRGFYVGGDGDVVINPVQGKTVTFKACSAGAYYPFAGVTIIKTVTTATNIVALF